LMIEAAGFSNIQVDQRQPGGSRSTSLPVTLEGSFGSSRSVGASPVIVRGGNEVKLYGKPWVRRLCFGG
jgi:hypothetical protein